MLRSVNTGEYNVRARAALIKLYGTEYPDPIRYNFSGYAERSILMMEYPGYLYGKHLDALKVIAGHIGDQGFFLTDPSKQDDNTYDADYVKHWYVPFDDSDDYGMRTEAFIYRPIHYSPQGIWGIVASEEGFGVLTGSNQFIDEFCLYIPEIKEDVKNFLIYWNYAKTNHPMVNVNWVSKVLENVYGEVQARKLLEEGKWRY